jgi:hypothetical protein
VLYLPMIYLLDLRFLLTVLYFLFFISLFHRTKGDNTDIFHYYIYYFNT